MSSAENGKMTGKGDHPLGIRYRIRGLAQGESPISLSFESALLDYPPFFGQASLTGTVRHEGDRIDIIATVSAKGRFECTRCAEPFQRQISAPLTIHLVPERLGKPGGDPDVHTYDPVGTSEIDLQPDIRDALVLSIPMRHLCREACKGICPICGKNNNLESCNCTEKGEEIGPVAALKSLRERLRAEENPTRNN